MVVLLENLMLFDDFGDFRGHSAGNLKILPPFRPGKILREILPIGGRPPSAPTAGVTARPLFHVHELSVADGLPEELADEGCRGAAAG